MNRFAALLIGLPLVAIYAPEAEAATTGALRGHIDDDMGLAIPGATVVLTGPNISGQMLVTTDDNGDFRFVSVPVGTHTMEITKSGFTPQKLKVTIRLDETAFAPIVLRVQGQAEIVIEETLPVIDTTKSSFSTELSSESLSNLPSPRNFGQATRMLPGVYGRVDTQDGGASGGNPSVRGEGQYGNNYFIDGISTRDPATHTFGQDMNFDAIDDIQVYTDGAPAEFGQATGMMVNVVTKDGGDEHHGSVSYFLSSNASWSKYLDDADHPYANYELLGSAANKPVFLDHEASLTAGGPIVKEKLWYFVALEGSLGHSKDDGWVDDNPDTEETDPTQWTDSQAVSGFGKVTWFPTADLSIQYQFKGSWDNTPNILVPFITYDADAQQQQTDSDWMHMLTARWRPDDKTDVELKGIITRSNVDVVPMSGDEDTPQIIDLDETHYSNNADSFDYNFRTNNGATLKITRLADGTTGHHKFKVGGEIFQLSSARQLIFTGPGDGVTYYASAAAGYPCEATDFSDCYGYREYTDAGVLETKDDVFTTYVQDDWQPVKNLTTNVGVRLDHEALFANAGNKVYDNWLPAPRIGLAWDVTGNNKTKVTGNYGRYYDIAGNSFADWGNTRSAYTYYEYRRDDFGDYYLYSSQDPAAEPLVYDENLKPYHMDKFSIGLEHEILPLFSVGIRGIVSQTVDIPEDVDADFNTWTITNPDSKRRDYRALEFTATKKLSDGWELMASYTLSESMGTLPGQFELSTGGQSGSDGNEVGVYDDDINDLDVRSAWMDQGYGWFLQGLAGLGTESDNAGWYGYLPYHSFHQIKVNADYTFKWGTTVGAVYEFDSGHAWQKRGYVELYGDYMAFPEGRGSRFMPAVNYVDLHLAQSLDLKNDRDLEIAIDVFNLFDFDTPINYSENDNSQFGEVVYRQAPRSIRGSLKFTY